MVFRFFCSPRRRRMKRFAANCAHCYRSTFENGFPQSSPTTCLSSQRSILSCFPWPLGKSADVFGSSRFSWGADPARDCTDCKVGQASKWGQNRSSERRLWSSSDFRRICNFEGLPSGLALVYSALTRPVVRSGRQTAEAFEEIELRLAEQRLSVSAGLASFLRRMLESVGADNVDMLKSLTNKVEIQRPYLRLGKCFVCP